MSAEGPELLALALALEAEGADDEQVIASLVELAQGSCISLMGASAYALSLARDMPYDTANERTLSLLTRALQQAVHMSGAVPSDDRATLLRQIVETSGGASMTPGAVASRVAQLDADLETLRITGDGEAPAAS